MVKFKEEFERRSKEYEKWKQTWSYIEMVIHFPQVIEYKVVNRFVENKHKWDQLFCFSGTSVCRYNKRSADDGEMSSSKRFHSLQ